MFSKDILADDEKAVDPQLGYPHGYAKLCRHAHIQMQGLLTPFTEGPPQQFLPYPPLEEELTKLKEFDALFPVIEEAERDPSSARRFAGYLWQQLDHLGNAGFDPAKFRIDAYGNVLYWNADSGSPLAWEVDHWFPHSRGGKTVPSNLRIVQWQVNQRKSTKLEFLVPWWDLQLGVSVNQFLSVFSSKNVDFRQRAFNLFFVNGESEQLDENLVVECHSWPQPFRERKHQIGLAAAAIVRVQRPMDDTLRALNGNRSLKQINPQAGGSATPARRRWSPDEEDALKKALQKFGPGNWKEIKEYEPLLMNRSTVQIKDKYRLMKGEWDKENREVPSSDRQIALFQKEEQSKQARAEERKQKEEHLLQLEAELQQLKDHNEKERVVLDELEQTLSKQRKRVEKQRKWSETQSQYRQCLEKMIRDTMHQCVLYKEQARLNQAACNALLARLESQKSACDSAEMDMTKRVKHRESLEALARPKITKRMRNDGHTDVGGCIKLNVGTSMDVKDVKTREWAQKAPFSERDRDKDNRLQQALRRKKVPESSEQHCPTSDDYRRTSDVFALEQHGNMNDLDTEELRANISAPMREQGVDAHITNCLKQEVDSDNLDIKGAASPAESSGSAGMKRKATEANDLEVDLLRYDSGEPVDDPRDDREEAEGMPNGGRTQPAGTTKDDQQLDELLQEVQEMKDKVNAAMEDAIKDEKDEEERVKRVGKFNLDKWLQALLLPGKDASGDPSPQLESQAKEDCARKLQEISPVEADSKTAERRVIESFSRLKLGGGGPGPNLAAAETSTDNSEVVFQIACETEFVEKMKAAREKEHRRKLMAKAGIRPQLQDLLGDSTSQEPSQEQERNGVGSPSPAFVPSPSPSPSRDQAARSDVIEQRRCSLGGKREENYMQLARQRSATLLVQKKPQFQNHSEQHPSLQQQLSSMQNRQQGLQNPKQSSNHPHEPKFQTAQQNYNSRQKFQHPIERSSSTPPAGQFRQVAASSPAQRRTAQAPGSREQAEVEEQWKQRQPSTSKLAPQLSRQLTAGHGAAAGGGGGGGAIVGGGGAARKASMLMKSASTRASSSSGGSPARSSSSGGGGGGAGRRGGEGEPEVASIRRKASFFQDWDVNENLRASLSHVWKKAVRKFDLARQPPPAHVP